MGFTATSPARSQVVEVVYDPARRRGGMEGAFMQVALHTELRPEAVDDYERLHRSIPDDLVEAMTAAGVHDWRIWRDGVHLFHVVDVDDYQAMRHALREHPANVAWQAVMVPLQAVPDDYSGGDTGLRLLWSFAGQIAER
jgi:L-rhamnose mutarotase